MSASEEGSSSSSGSGSSSDVSIHTEPGLDQILGPPADAIPRPDQGTVEAFREFWKSNPRNNLWTTKGSLWPRFKKEVLQGQSPEQASISGANVTLLDLERSELPEPSEAGEAAAQLPSDEEWFGTPDPAKFVPGTNLLTPQQLEEERAKGNIMTRRDMRLMLEQAEDWELEAMSAMLEIQRLKHRTFVQDPETGRYISLWDLYNYVHHNPQLKALAERGLNTVATSGSPDSRMERIDALVRLTPSHFQPEASAMMLPRDMEAALPWGICGVGQYWSRRPLRWLKGLGGRWDFSYALYAREQDVEDLLGPKWGGRDPREVLGQQEYWQELVQAGPLVGMTLMAVAERPLELAEAQRTWSAAVQQQLERLASGSQASTSTSTSSSSSSSAELERSDAGTAAAAGALVAAGPQRDILSSSSSDAVQQLVQLFDLEALQKTALLDVQRKHLRPGTTLYFTATEDGMLVQAQSPGKLKDQQTYLLGHAGDADLCRAVLSLFMDPQQAVDPEAAYSSGKAMLAMANGYRTSQHELDLERAVAVSSSQLKPGGRGAVWRLPAVGAAPADEPLVQNVRLQLVMNQLHQAYVDALRAASEAEDDFDDPQMGVVARRAAAEASLRRSFAAMGLDAEGLTIPPPDLSSEVYSLALPLQQSAGST